MRWLTTSRFKSNSMKMSLIFLLGSLILALILGFLTLNLAQATENLIESKTDIKRQQILEFKFMNESEKTWKINYVFFLNGSLLMNNTLGDEFYVSIPKLPNGTVQTHLYYNSSHVAHRYIVNGFLDMYVHYDFSYAKDRLKITIQGTSTKEIEIEYEFKNPKAKHIRKGTHRYTIGDLSYDWKDMQGVTEFELSDNKLKIKLAKEFEIDPFLVGTSEIWGTDFNYQTKHLRAQGLDWLAYGDGSDIVYRTSEDDGKTWSSKTVIKSCPQGQGDGDYFDWTINSGYIHYAYASRTESQNVSYRMGTPNNDGTITWVADEQMVFDPPDRAVHPSICIDSNGYSVIAFRNYSIAPNPQIYNVQVVKNSVKNGSWITDWSSNLMTTLGLHHVKLMSLTSGGELYALWSNVAPVYYFRGKLYNGTDWGDFETISKDPDYVRYLYGFSACSDLSDDIHLVFVNQTCNNVVYYKRTNTTGTWNLGVDISGSGKDIHGCTISPYAGGLWLFVFWSNTTTISYRYGIAEIWLTIYDWVLNNDINGVTLTMTPIISFIDDRIGIAWTESTSPYKVMFQLFVIGIECYDIISDASNNNNRAYINEDVFLRYRLRFSHNQSDVDSGTLQVNGTDHSILSGWCNFSRTNTLTGNYSYVVTAIDVNGETDYTQMVADPWIFWEEKFVITGTEGETSGDEGFSISIPQVDRIPMAGLWVVVGGVGIFAISALIKKVSRPSRRGKPRGVQAKKTPTRRIRKPRQPKTTRIRKPRRSKRSGRFTH